MLGALFCPSRGDVKWSSKPSTHSVCYDNSELAFKIIDTLYKMMAYSILARIALPPYARNANLRRLLHRIPIRDSSSVKHGLFHQPRQL